MKLTYGSLFSGVGGFDLGFDRTGFECVFQVEWDKHCQQILAKHWPEVPKWLDVQEVNGAEIPPCDVLIFGSPCQDLSVAGKRAGLDGTKSSMFYEATRIIKEMRNATESVYPRVVVWENVPGALSSNNGADFGQVLDTLAECGAVDIQWSILDAQHFGVPQRRRRIFVVAIFDPTAAEQCPETLLPVIEGSRGDFKKSRTARKNATGHATPSVDSSGQWAAGSTDEDILSTSVCSKWAKGSGGPSGSEHYNMVVESEIVGALCARDSKGIGNQYVDENKLVVQGMFAPSGFADYVEGMGTLRTTEMGAGASHLVVPFVKSRRAQNNTDDETWVEGEVTPTLNAFDNSGETRATVLMPVAYSIREDAKANTFSATETDVALCLNGLVPSTQSHHAQIFIAEPQLPFVFDGTRHDDFRMDTETVPTLKQRMGTGGGQVPMVAEAIITHEVIETLKARGHKGVNTEEAAGGQLVVEPIVYDGYNQKLDDSGIHRSLRIGRDSSDFIAQPILSFDTQFGSNANVFEDQSPTLKATQQSPSIAYEEVIGFASLNGLDIQDSTEVFPVLRTTSLNHAVAVSFAYDALNDTPSEVHPTLRATHGSNGDFIAQPPSVSMAFSHYSSDASPSIEISPTLRSGTNGTGHAVLTSQSLAVRRLTPLECERLMGWPDDHTRWRADGKEQADTNRYKQCGNGVATPVAAWIAKHIKALL